MSEANSQGHSAPVSYASGMTARKTYLVQIGGALGIAGSIIGLGIFLMACAGFDAAFSLSLIPLALGVPGLILTIIGGFAQETPGLEDTAAIAAIFVNVC